MPERRVCLFCGCTFSDWVKSFREKFACHQLRRDCRVSSEVQSVVSIPLPRPVACTLAQTLAYGCKLLGYPRQDPDPSEKYVNRRCGAAYSARLIYFDLLYGLVFITVCIFFKSSIVRTLLKKFSCCAWFFSKKTFRRGFPTTEEFEWFWWRRARGPPIELRTTVDYCAVDYCRLL